MCPDIRHFEYLGEPGTLRHVPATSNRPHVIYISHPSAPHVMNHLVTGSSGLPSAECPGGIYFVPEGDLSRSYLPPAPPEACELRKQLEIPDNCIVVEEIDRQAPRDERLHSGAILRHEFEHFLGGGEYRAFKAGDDYKVRCGLDSDFETPRDIRNFVDQSRFYSVAELAHSILEEWEGENSRTPSGRT